MSYRYLLLFLFCFSQSGLFAQISFTKRTELLTPEKHYSGVAIAVLDMNGDGRDDIVRMDQGFRLAVEYQTIGGEAFTHQDIDELRNGSQWGMCAADVDNNGVPDVLAGGRYDGIKVAMANAEGSAFDVVSYDDPEVFAQCVNFADINMDGWVDAFVCHDDGTSRIFLNDSTGAFVYAPDAIDLNTLPASDNSGNYGSVWSDVDNDGDLDIYIAKCRQGVSSSSDGRRINQLFLNNGAGTYVQDTADMAGLRIGAQSWTADFGDIDNDGDFDCFITNHDVSSQLLENDGSGHFTDISSSAGLFNAIAGLPIQAVFRDFDNDGFVDILVAGSVHSLYRNNGDKTFTAVQILDGNEMESYALGDLNFDGFQDIYAGYADIYTDPSNIPDALWFNDGNDNHFVGLNLRGVQSNSSAVGTKVYLYSALGTQVREVRSGESYGIMNSMQIHFGMGQLTTLDSIVVHWPSGTTDVLLAPDVDQYLTVEEGKCVIPQVSVVANGSTVFCSGGSVEIALANGFDTYLWSTGSTDSSIVVQASGLYTVTITVAAGCTAVSNAVAVVVDPVEVPIITAETDTSFCIGGSVVLNASAATSYLWSTGATTPSIEVSETGLYSVVTQGMCEQFSSAPMKVTALEAPLPIPTADTVALNSSASLSSTGDELIWYDAPIAGNILYIGNPFVTMPLDSTTMFWVANNALYGLPNQSAGMLNHMGSNFAGPQTNGQIIFDCFAPFKLLSVKLSANQPGIRMVELRDASGTVLESVEVNVPAGTIVADLDMSIPVGTDLVLTTNQSVNQQSLGSNGPQLRRSDQGVSYPYEVPGYLSIKSSNYGMSRYYYFFDWEVDLPGQSCLSDRVPVRAFVDSSLVRLQEIPNAGNIQLYPNPNTGQFILDWEQFGGGALQLQLINAQGQLLQAKQYALPAGPLRLPVQFSSLPAGLYALKLRAPEGTAVRRLIIE